MSESYREACWLLKTTAGDTGIDHWKHFLQENVVSIGWNNLKPDPTAMSQSALTVEFEKLYPESRRTAQHAAKTIHTFKDVWHVGDIVIICRGYPPNSKQPVHIYGFARITSDCYFDSTSDWWKIKRHAKIQPSQRDVPQLLFTDYLGKKSARQTIHEVDINSYRKFANKLLIETKISIKV
jgi:hypothetical protein